MRRLSLGVLAMLCGLSAAAEESAPQADPPAPDRIFPIPGVEKASPQFAEGEYGAFRPGRRHRRDCGRGHCGIDLCAPVGTAVIAVEEGVVAQIDESTTGEGGRWIRLQHADGTATWYMHLRRIREGLHTGETVHAGQAIATLGRTGVTTSPTHLHFAWTSGKPGRERYLDPNRLLDGATLVAAPVEPEPRPLHRHPPPRSMGPEL